MPYRSLLLSLALLCSSLTWAQFRNAFPKPEAAENTVRDFCRLDYLGGRLSAAGWARMKPLTTWSDNPAWKTFRIVARYDQTGEAAGYHSVRVTVRYLSLGRFELGIGFTPLRDPEEVQFTVKQVDDDWRIDTTDSALFEPHVSQASAVQWLQEKLKSVTDPGDKASIESALKRLQGKP